MRIRTFMRAAVTTTLILGAAVIPAHAFDVTGHWVGKWSCKGFNGTKFSEQIKTSTLDITQSGSTIHARFEQSLSALYSGAAIPAAAKPEKGEVVLTSCQTNAISGMSDGNSEMIRAPVATKPGSAKATLKGLSIFENDIAPFGQQVETCKFTYKRVNTNDPAVGSCP